MTVSHIRLNIKLFVLVTVVYTVVGLAGELFLGFLLPAEYFGLFPAISIFYWVMGLILTFSLNHFRKANPDKLMNIFMLMKTIKFMCTVLFLILYVTYEPEVKMQFSVSLMCNYFIYSVLEMYIYFLYNKKITKPGDPNHHETKE